MKWNRIIMFALILLFARSALALAVDDFYIDIEAPDMDWFSAGEAFKAQIPDGLSEREAEIYRMAYARGHYDALHPGFIDGEYVLNTKTKKYHLTNCPNTLLIHSANREHFTGSLDELHKNGYSPCGTCKPENAK